MNRFLFLIVLWLLMLPISGYAQTHSPFPVDIISGPSPQAFMVDGRLRLVYELHITNYAPWPVDIMRLDVLGAAEKPMISYDPQALSKMVVPAENIMVPSVDTLANARSIEVGHSAVVFVEVGLDSGMQAPPKLGHRFSFSYLTRNGNRSFKTLLGPAVSLVSTPLPVLQAPLRGNNWVAFNSFSSHSHRRSFNPVDGRMRIAERYAIDWMSLGPDGREFHNDTKSNTNFYCYGADVLAVANARVSALVDSFSDNEGSSARGDRAITLDNIVGNYLILDLGHGRFALYAHLQKGSMNVRLGDTVKAGQVLALLGNSGNSDAPHLHFQMMDTNSPMGAEGLPYAFEGFTQIGVIKSAEAVDEGKAWQPESAEKPSLRRYEFPIDNAVVGFP
jgi:murein DD-endopeptidase MepM/ murein hydrolase activator NlpD